MSPNSRSSTSPGIGPAAHSPSSQQRCVEGVQTGDTICMRNTDSKSEESWNSSPRVSAEGAGVLWTNISSPAGTVCPCRTEAGDASWMIWTLSSNRQVTSWITKNGLSVPNFAKHQQGPAVPGTVLGSRENTLFPAYRTASHCFSSLSFPAAL